MTAKLPVNQTRRQKVQAFLALPTHRNATYDFDCVVLGKYALGDEGEVVVKVVDPGHKWDGKELAVQGENLTETTATAKLLDNQFAGTAWDALRACAAGNAGPLDKAGRVELTANVKAWRTVVV